MQSKANTKAASLSIHAGLLDSLYPPPIHE